ncbi:Rha family transcriptional regulator [Lederbergia lenta]|uniref:Rha family transcriptional regulator n=1 Tax=Lederbergia lenta TaxID=1467 RepID=UPI00203B8B70|nr:Rha family transcriptional regulator [Lederbergia lenta]MCM3110642.1 Rha family transcriptional regulator [Lederbergia lenta]
MNQLVFIQNNRPVTDSLTVAEMFDKDHKNVLRDINTQIEYAGPEFSQLNFEPSEYVVRGKRYPKFNLTEEAFALVVFSYNTKEAVRTKIAFIQEFKKLRQQLNKPMSPAELALLQAQNIYQLEQKVETHESKLTLLETKVDEQITLDHGEQRRLQKAVSIKAYELCSDPTERPRYFREIYREIKDRFAVASYKDVKRHELQSAIRYVENWIPRKVS